MKISEIYPDILKKYEVCLLKNNLGDFLEIIPIGINVFASTYWLSAKKVIDSTETHVIKHCTNFTLNYEIIDFIPKIDCDCDRFEYEVIRNKPCPHGK